MNDKSKKPNQRTGKPGVSSSNNDKNQARAKQAATQASGTSKAAPATSAAASGQTDTKRTTTQAAASTQRSSTTTTRTASGNSGNNRNTTTHTVQEKKGGGGWLPPVALLFGLLGTLLSAYLWSKLNALSESTTTALSQQQESTKTEVATVKTELTTALEETSATVDTKVAELDTKLETTMQETSTGLQANMQSMGDEIRSETKSGNEEIATSTATAMQELTSNSESELNVISTSFNTGIRSLREDMDARFAENDTQVAGISESLATTYELASRGQKDWILAEVEYLLRTGHHRVKLAGDVKAGVLALESANDRLHALGDIDYFPVREQIKQEVTELRRLGPPDIEGLIFRLETAGKVADSLPLRESPKAAGDDSAAEGEEAASGASAIGKSLMSKLNFSVAPSDPSKPRAKRRSPPTKVQLSASEALNTHLQAARLSALRADAERFQNHMDNAMKYSDEMFDDSQDSVQTFTADLANIRETSIVPNIPILGSALSMFEKIDAKRGEK